MERHGVEALGLGVAVRGPMLEQRVNRLLALNRLVPFRVDSDGERIGMHLHELGGGAYPEFRDQPR